MFEYKLIFSYEPRPDITEVNKLSKEGWDLVQMAQSAYPASKIRWAYILRSEVKPPPGTNTFVGVFTVSVQEDRILVASHGLVNGNQIKFVLDDPTTCALPTPLAEISSYFVVGARGNDFQVSGSSGGPVINLTDKGTGSNEVWK